MGVAYLKQILWGGVAKSYFLNSGDPIAEDSSESPTPSSDPVISFEDFTTQYANMSSGSRSAESGSVELGFSIPVRKEGTREPDVISLEAFIAGPSQKRARVTVEKSLLIKVENR